MKYLKYILLTKNPNKIWLFKVFFVLLRKPKKNIVMAESIYVTSSNSKIVDGALFVTLLKAHSISLNSPTLRKKINHKVTINHPSIGKMVKFDGPYSRSK